MWAALLGWLGCGQGFDCTRPFADLVPPSAGVQALTCEEGLDVVEYIELLAARPVTNGDDTLILGEIAERYRADPRATRAWLAEVKKDGAALEALAGIAGAEQRSREVYRAETGKGVIRSDMGDVWGAQDRALGVWAKSDAEQLAITESDLEAWIRFASLCREVQGGGTLRISVADRVSVYRVLVDRFEHGDRSVQLALGALGGVWSQIADHWQLANYEQQQAWIQRTPLPPPMTASSLGYAEAVFNGDVSGLVTSVYQTLGPFAVGGDERRFGTP